MLKAVDMKIGEALNLMGKDNSIELKADGSRQFAVNGRLFSEREIDNTKKFSQISDALKGINASIDGEIILNWKSTVFDVNKKENWRKCVYIVFDILELNGKDLRNKTLKERQKLLENLVGFINSPFVQFIPKFPEIDVAWEYITNNSMEGIVIKDNNSSYPNLELFKEKRVKSWIKVKHFKEGKEKIIGYENGSVKGAFLLENGSKISALSESVVNIYKSYSDIPLFAEFDYLQKTKDNSYFQPILKHITDVNGVKLW